MASLMVKSIFMEAQSGTQSHGKLIKDLHKVFDKMESEDFEAEFIELLKYSLVVFKREAAVERTLDFVAKFAASLYSKSDDEMPTFLQTLIGFLLKHHKACERAVRYRCCQMINKILVSLGEEAQIDDDLYEKIYDCMLERLRDKFPVVRVQAVLALARLQDPMDHDCPVIKAYLFLLGCDNSADVRRAVLMSIAASTKTLPAMLERTRDSNDAVRRLAFVVLAEKVHIRALTIAQRVTLLQQGLSDRTEAVKQACTSRLVQAWLRNFDANVLDLLNCLDVESSLDTCRLMLTAVFKTTPPHELVTNFTLLDDRLVIPLDQLTAESALYWSSLCEYLRSLGTSAEEHLERVLPTGTHLANYIASVMDKFKTWTELNQQLTAQFILHRLLELINSLDMADEAGRQNLSRLLKTMLTNEYISHALVEPLFSCMVKVIPESGVRLTRLLEVISDIRMPIVYAEETPASKEERRKLELKLASVRVELNQIRDILDSCLQRQDYEGAAQAKVKVTELEEKKSRLLEESTPRTQEVQQEKTDPDTLLKCLTISCSMLQSTSLRSLTPQLQTLLEVLILPGIQNEDPAVRNVAVQALGLCCLLSRDCACKHLLLFTQMAQMDQERVQVTSLHVIFDLLLTYGLDTFNEAVEVADDDASDSASDDPRPGLSLLQILISLLDTQSSEVRATVAEGLAKLLLCGRVVSPRLLSRLLLLWYNPLTEEDVPLRHCLGTFLPIYAFAGSSNQSVVAEAVVPTLKTLLSAPASSPLSDVNVNNVCELLVQLTNSRHLVNKKQDVCCHDALIRQVCNEILSVPHPFDMRVWCRVLTMLSPSTTDQVLNKELKVLSQLMLKKVKDKQSVKVLEKFHRRVKDTLERLGDRPGEAAPSSEEKEEETKEESVLDVTDKIADTTADITKSRIAESPSTKGALQESNTVHREKPRMRRAQPRSFSTNTATKNRRAANNSDSDFENDGPVVRPSVLRRSTRARSMIEQSRSESHDLADLISSDSDSDSDTPMRTLQRSKKLVLESIDDSF